ncbi:MAG: DUF2192 domain-containing protein [Thermoprotei archaeon]|nr:DUF2192 domain-containing protein [Thermoprotei archaeon]
MSATKRLYSDRTETCIEIWGMILEGIADTRGKIRALLEEYYNERNIEPIRGKTKIDIFDKELITLYIVGKYGLGLQSEARKIFDGALELESKCDLAYHMMRRGENPRDVMNKVFGSLDSPILFRVLRFAVTLTLLGFEREENLIKTLQSVANAFPEYASRFPLFARFYITLRLGEAIALGKIRTPLEKETMKHALCMKMGFSKCAPSDTLIYDIAKSIYKVKEEKLRRLLSLREDQDSRIETS